MTALITETEFNTITGTYMTTVFPEGSAGYRSQLLDDLSAHVEEILQSRFTEVTVTNERRHSHVIASDVISATPVVLTTGTTPAALYVRFEWKPVISVTSIKQLFGNTTSDLSLTNMILFSEAGYALIPWSTSGIGTGVITLSTYKTGYAETPDLVKRGIALLVWEALMADSRAVNQGQASEIESFRIRSYSERRALLRPGEVPVGLGTGLSRRAWDFLKPFKRSGLRLH